MRKRVRHTQLMKLVTTPLLGSHVRIQLQLCKFFQAFFFQFFFLFHLGQEVLDPILTFFIRTRDESHCINKICPKTQRFQTFSQPVGWILLSTPMRERQLSSTVEVLAILYSKLRWRTRRNKPSIFPILIAAFASLNILRPISPVVCNGIPRGSSAIP